MCDVECEHKNKCTSYPNWCQSCQNNKGKKNYYRPEPIPYYPPYNPWIPYITCTTSNYMTGNYCCSNTPYKGSVQP